MRHMRCTLRPVALLMAAVMFMTSLPLFHAQAAMVATDSVIEQAVKADDRARVMEFMAREDVRRQMESLGIDPDEAAQRAESLSDEEIQQIAGQLDQLPAGQDTLIGVVLAAILIVLLVLLITDLVGVTDVFPFIKSQR